MARDRPTVTLGEVTPNNLGQLKRLNSVLFPVAYNEKFYKGLLETPEYARLAYFNDCAVGAVCVKRELMPDGKNAQLYIMTLGVLAPYRRLNVGSELLTYASELAGKDPSIKQLYLHVQVGNEDALKFYESKGFAITGLAEKYYRQIEPADAHILSKAYHTSS